MQTEQLLNSILDDLSQTLHQVDNHQIDTFRTTILKADRIFVAGKGRTGLQMKGFAMRLMHLGLKVHVIGEVTTPGIQKSDLLIIGSGSGRTASLLGYAKSAVLIGTSIALITGDKSSPIAELSNPMVYIPASNFKSGRKKDRETVLLMGSLFEHALGLFCDLLTIQLKEQLQKSETEMQMLHANLE